MVPALVVEMSRKIARKKCRASPVPLPADVGPYGQGRDGDSGGCVVFDHDVAGRDGEPCRVHDRDRDKFSPSAVKADYFVAQDDRRRSAEGCGDPKGALFASRHRPAQVGDLIEVDPWPAGVLVVVDPRPRLLGKSGTDENLRGGNQGRRPAGPLAERGPMLDIAS